MAAEGFYVLGTDFPSSQMKTMNMCVYTIILQGDEGPFGSLGSPGGSVSILYKHPPLAKQPHTLTLFGSNTEQAVSDPPRRWKNTQLCERFLYCIVLYCICINVVCFNCSR